MNSVQLAQRLARNLNVPDIFDLEAEPALDVLAAINAGLQSFYRELPGIYKRATISQTVRAPRTLSVTFKAKYSNVCSVTGSGDDPFSSNETGCTIRYDTSAADSIIESATSVLDGYINDTLITGATIYYDAIPIQDVIERVIGAVRLYSASRAEPTPLIRDERLRGGRVRRFMASVDPDEISFPYDSAYLSEIGRPRYYYLDPAGESRGGDPEFLLRVSPMPDTDYTVRMEAELSTERIVFNDLATARAIYVADAYVDDLLVPLCEAELVTSKFWANADQKKDILSRRDSVLQSKIPKIPKDIAPPSNGIGRPWGF